MQHQVSIPGCKERTDIHSPIQLPKMVHEHRMSSAHIIISLAQTNTRLEQVTVPPSRIPDPVCDVGSWEPEVKQ